MASFNIKVKHYDKSVSAHKKVEGKKIASIIGTTLKESVIAMASTGIVESVRQHNERVVLQAAIFFQRVVTRTPKDETYYDPITQVSHKADTDFVWKSWKISYWGKSVTAEDMGEELFENESAFNDKNKINAIADIIKNTLFRGESKFNSRKTRIRNIRIENKHNRFAMLEYGSYKQKNSIPKEGDEHFHGIQNGYSVQAPYGMLRITQAEMESMSIDDFDKWFKRYKSNTANITRVPSRAQMKKLVKLMENKRHLSMKDIDAIAQVYEVGND